MKKEYFECNFDNQDYTKAFKTNDKILYKIWDKAQKENYHIDLIDILLALNYYKLLYLNSYYNNYEILCLKDDYINNIFNQLQFRLSPLFNKMNNKELRNSLNNNECVKDIYQILVKSDKNTTNKLLKLTNNNTVSIDKVNFEYIYLNNLEEEVKENN